MSYGSDIVDAAFENAANVKASLTIRKGCGPADQGLSMSAMADGTNKQRAGLTSTSPVCSFTISGKRRRGI